MMRFIETLYADPLLKFLVDTTMKSFVIFAVAGLFAFCLRRKSAAMRGFVWSMALVGCLIIPLFSLVLPKWELGILPETPVSMAQSQLSTDVGVVYTHHTDTATTRSRDQSECSLYYTPLDRLGSNSLGRGRTVSAYPFECRHRCCMAHLYPQQRLQPCN